MIVPLRSSVPKSRLNAFLLRGNAALRPRGGTWFNHVQPEGTFRRTWQRLRARLKFATSGWWKIELYIQRPCVFADLFFPAVCYRKGQSHEHCSTPNKLLVTIHWSDAEDPSSPAKMVKSWNGILVVAQWSASIITGWPRLGSVRFPVT